MYTQCEFLLHELRVKFDWKEKVILNIDNYFENRSYSTARCNHYAALRKHGEKK